MKLANQERHVDRSALYRALGLVLIGLGGVGAGSALHLSDWFIAASGFPPSVLAGLGAGIAVFGILIGQLPGMVIFGVGNALMGAAWLEGSAPVWLASVAAPFIIVGIGLRMFNSD